MLSRMSPDAARVLLDALHRKHHPALETTTVDVWPQVDTLAARQGLAPLLHARLEAHRASAWVARIPATVRHGLQERARANATRNLRLIAVASQIARTLGAHGIDTVALKGLHLAFGVYTSPALRTMNDIDVLVHPDRLDDARRVLLAAGATEASQIPTAAILDAHQHLPRMRFREVDLEVHWRLAGPATPPVVDPDALWTRTQPQPRLGLQTLVPEAALVHLCAHGGSHVFELGLRPLYDIDALVARSADRLDWNVVVALARSWQCARATALVLTLAERHVGTPVPHEVWAMLADAQPDAETTSRALRHAVSMGGHLMEVSQAAGSLVAPGPVHQKVRYAWSRIALPDAMLLTVYPTYKPDAHRFARPLMVGRRLFDLISRYALRLPQLAVSSSAQTGQALADRNALMAWMHDPSA